ncbi:MAG: prolyl oligopeptidase family serine peptidase [Sphingobacterium sp.]
MFLLLLLSCSLKAQFKAVVVKTGYSYLLHSPDNKEYNNKKPLLVFLHGRSLSGHNLNKVKRYGVLRAIEKGRKIDAVVIAPQTANGWDSQKIINLIDEVIKTHSIDEHRIYVCGMSMGGYGTIDLLGESPERFAAAVAICGGGSAKFACNLTKRPLWILHGTADRVVPASESKKIYNAIKQCNSKADVTLTLISGGTHGSVENLFHQDEMYDFMFKQVKE